MPAKGLWDLPEMTDDGGLPPSDDPPSPLRGFGNRLGSPSWGWRPRLHAFAPDGAEVNQSTDDPDVTLHQRRDRVGVQNVLHRSVGSFDRRRARTAASMSSTADVSAGSTARNRSKNPADHSSPSASSRSSAFTISRFRLMRKARARRSTASRRAGGMWTLVAINMLGVCSPPVYQATAWATPAPTRIHAPSPWRAARRAWPAAPRSTGF
jgi:hypothetical protein